MITTVAKGKYGVKLADFLVAHLPKKDGSGTVDYYIEDIDALNTAVNELSSDCNELRGPGGGNGKGAVGGVFKDSECCKM